MVTESPRAITASADELLAHVDTLRADADLMDGYARRLLATAATLSGCRVGWPGGGTHRGRGAAQRRHHHVPGEVGGRQ
ncbi:hypothetical protein ACWD4N_45750, partial [Streptomyces sp. NPDC002586]